jgi:hypothetical protein
LCRHTFGWQSRQNALFRCGAFPIGRIRVISAVFCGWVDGWVGS